MSEEWTYNGHVIPPPAHFRVDGDIIPPLPPGFTRTTSWTWNQSAIAQTLAQRIGSVLNREAGRVIIRRTEAGTIAFDGIGTLGRTLLSKQAAILTAAALEQGVSDIVLPVREIQPQIVVLDPELLDQGIQHVVAVGESDFRGSPEARTHNITVGLSKFNGTLIPKGATFSFNAVLGRVDASTGYWKELVILGPHTLPEYGGGLCQVSTTAYRGVWEAGFPMVQRRNHSFAVRYYGPQGTDATIFPPHTDMQFVNDGPSSLLIQTNAQHGFATFIYYGTRDDRDVEILGPKLWDVQEPPPDREEFTTDIPPGTTRKVSERVPGMKALWFRFIRKGEEEIAERVFSAYEARGLLTQIGAAALPPNGTEASGINERGTRESPRPREGRGG